MRRGRRRRDKGRKRRERGEKRVKEGRDRDKNVLGGLGERGKREGRYYVCGEKKGKREKGEEKEGEG